MLTVLHAFFPQGVMSEYVTSSLEAFRSLLASLTPLYRLSSLLRVPVALLSRCNSSWGRRRPFIVGGMILTVIGMLLLGWTRELGSLILGEGRVRSLLLSSPYLRQPALSHTEQALTTIYYPSSYSTKP
jgi:hypothetical protein